MLGYQNSSLRFDAVVQYVVTGYGLTLQYNHKNFISVGSRLLCGYRLIVSYYSEFLLVVWCTYLLNLK